MAFFKIANNEQNNKKQQSEMLTKDLLFNVNRLKEAFSFPVNHALQMRELYLPSVKSI
ncbi:hypothetical protein ACI2OX_02250 [Bacillus sp. N9]